MYLRRKQVGFRILLLLCAGGIPGVLAGFYLITDPAENALNLPSGAYDIPLMLQDRTLDPDNRLSYEQNEQAIEKGVSVLS